MLRLSARTPRAPVLVSVVGTLLLYRILPDWQRKKSRKFRISSLTSGRLQDKIPVWRKEVAAAVLETPRGRQTPSE
jgi:hypothetical protein